MEKESTTPTTREIVCAVLAFVLPLITVVIMFFFIKDYMLEDFPVSSIKAQVSTPSGENVINSQVGSFYRDENGNMTYWVGDQLASTYSHNFSKAKNFFMIDNSHMFFTEGTTGKILSTVTCSVSDVFTNISSVNYENGRVEFVSSGTIYYINPRFPDTVVKLRPNS